MLSIETLKKCVQDCATQREQAKEAYLKADGALSVCKQMLAIAETNAINEAAAKDDSGVTETTGAAAEPPN